MRWLPNPLAPVLARLSAEVRKSVSGALGGAVSGLASILRGIEERLRADLVGAEDRVKAHTEHAVEETRALILREIRAELDARLPADGTALPRTDLPAIDGPRVPRRPLGGDPTRPLPGNRLPPGRPHP